MNKNICFISVPSSHGGNINGSELAPDLITNLDMVKSLKGSCFLNLDCKNFEKNNFVKSVCSKLKTKTHKALKDGFFPFVLGGDHSISTGSLSAVSSFFFKKNKYRPGLIWFDAHADLNTHLTSPSGNMHGMPLASLIGEDVKHLSDVVDSGLFDTEKVVFLGLRDLDPGERNLLEERNISHFSVERIREEGIENVSKRVSSIIGSDYCLSFDVDSLDPSCAPGVGTPVTNGFHLEEAISLLDLILKKGNLVSLDFVEYNPLRDIDKKTQESVKIFLNFLISKIS